MKYISLFILIILVSCSKGQISDKRIKSITKTINNTILEKQEFDINGKLVFEYHNQIDFGQENSIIFITAFEYDTINKKTIEYHANSNSSLDLTVNSFDINSSLRKNELGIFDEIKDRQLYRQSLFNSNSRDKFIEFFKSNYPSDLPFKYSYEYSDTIKTQVFETLKNDTIIIETTKIQDGYTREYSKVYHNSNKKKIKEIIQGKYNRLIENIYDEEGLLILQKETGKYHKYYYDNKLLIRKEVYHGNALAFKDEYYYENGILVKEIRNRETSSKYFQNIPQELIILYSYEYY